MKKFPEFLREARDATLKGIGAGLEKTLDTVGAAISSCVPWPRARKAVVKHREMALFALGATSVGLLFVSPPAALVGFGAFCIYDLGSAQIGYRDELREKKPQPAAPEEAPRPAMFSRVKQRLSDMFNKQDRRTAYPKTPRPGGNSPPPPR